MKSEDSMLTIGDKIPKFNATIDNNQTFNFTDTLGQNLVLYFYPKDNTPGCTKEAIGFSVLAEAFSAENTMVIGVSRDSVKKHLNFICKHNLGIHLIADEDGAICKLFDTWVEKQMYGKSYMGIERSTYLIDTDAKISKIWRKVKVNGHVEEVLGAVQDLNK